MPESTALLLGKGIRTLRRQGPKALVRKAAGWAVQRLADPDADLPIDPQLIADSQRLELTAPATPPARDRPLTVGWLCTPPAFGSGGHTTMFRMVQALERAGHRCRIYLYDRHLGDLETYRKVIRLGWPQVNAEVLFHSGLSDSPSDTANPPDACIATSWESAHVLASIGSFPLRRLYFIQDYEPYFYPHGTMYALAQDSYRFGFRCIALGPMIADCLSKDLGVSSDVVDFGCDSTTYHLTTEVHTQRQGVVCYARPQNQRRGWDLARLALAEFHRQRPDVPIVIYGADVRNLPFPAEVHPYLSTGELNRLYNRSVAGIALSFTNVSLVPEELLCAGAIPIVNDAAEPRSCLDNPFVAWAAPTPAGIADAMSEVVSHPDIAGRARAAAASVDNNWGRTEQQVVTVIENECYGAN